MRDKFYDILRVRVDNIQVRNIELDVGRFPFLMMANLSLYGILEQESEHGEYNGEENEIKRRK